MTRDVGDFGGRVVPVNQIRAGGDLGVGPRGYRLLIAGGELLDTAENRFQGNSAIFRPAGGAHHLLDTLLGGGWEHHVAVAHGNLSHELGALAQLLGIEAVVV